MSYLPIVHDEADRLGYFARVLRDARVIIADAGTPIGFAAVANGWLEHLYVLPERVGQGVGSALLRAALAGEGSLDLYVFQRNERARRFYEARGFTLVALTDGADNEEREPDAHYRWAAPA